MNENTKYHYDPIANNGMDRTTSCTCPKPVPDYSMSGDHVCGSCGLHRRPVSTPAAAAPSYAAAATPMMMQAPNGYYAIPGAMDYGFQQIPSSVPCAPSPSCISFYHQGQAAAPHQQTQPSASPAHQSPYQPVASGHHETFSNYGQANGGGPPTRINRCSVDDINGGCTGLPQARVCPGMPDDLGMMKVYHIPLVFIAAFCAYLLWTSL